MHPRRSTLSRLLCAAAIATFGSAAAAQDAYPNRPIRFITPFPPGATTDLATRMVAEKLGQAWGQQVIVENRPGGNTVIGTQAVARSAPDGYTVLVTTNAHPVTPLLLNAPYDAIKDFMPVGTITRGEWVLVAHPSVPANNLREFIALLKSRPNELNYATSGSGGASHLATELFGMLADVKARHIPYKGGAAVIPDLLAGQVQFTFAVPVAVTNHVKAGKLKAIAVTGDERLAGLPEVPTFRESGLTGFNAGYWVGALVPAGTPEAVVDKLSTEIRRIVGTPESRDRLMGVGAQPFPSTRQQFGTLLADDVERYGKLIRSANIKLE